MRPDMTSNLDVVAGWPESDGRARAGDPLLLRSPQGGRPRRARSRGCGRLQSGRVVPRQLPGSLALNEGPTAADEPGRAAVGGRGLARYAPWP